MNALVLTAILAAAPDTVVVGLLADPMSLDPHHATDVVSAAVIANVCEPFVRLRADGSRHEAALATTWATVDNRHWTFTLRTGVRFHDGTPLDADAVVANLEHLRVARGFPARAERGGPAVVSITLERPNAALLATLSQPFFALQSPRQLGRREGHRLVGTGPFQVMETKPGLLALEAYPNYWGGAPRPRRVLFRRFASAYALAAALAEGEADVSSAALGPEHLARLRSHPEMSLDAQTGLNLAFLSINNERRPFSDRRVRTAIARAIDRPQIVARVLGGHGEAARGPLPPSLWDRVPRGPELLLDRALARRLLREAGWADGFEATLLVSDSPRPYNPAPVRLAERIAADLGQVGIRLRVEKAPTWTDFIERSRRGDYELAVMGWQADTSDPNDFLSTLLGSESVGGTNRSRYRSPQMDAFLEQGRRSGDSRERATIYREAQAQFQRDMPWAPLYHVSVFTAYRRSLQGLLIDPLGIVRFEKVWKKE